MSSLQQDTRQHVDCEAISMVRCRHLHHDLFLRRSLKISSSSIFGIESLESGFALLYLAKQVHHNRAMCENFHMLARLHRAAHFTLRTWRQSSFSASTMRGAATKTFEMGTRQAASATCRRKLKQSEVASGEPHAKKPLHCNSDSATKKLPLSGKSIMQ